MAVLGYLGAALAVTLLPAASGPLPVAMVMAAVGIGLPFFFGAIANIAISGVVLATVPEGLLGRLTVSVQLVLAVAGVGGALVGGVLGQAVGITPTLWLAAGLSVATAAFLGLSHGLR
jgi:hypothetical protein